MSLDDFRSPYEFTPHPADLPQVQSLLAPGEQSGDDSFRRYQIVSVSDLLNREFPKRNFLLGQWLEERTLAMIYGTRGVGKSYLTLSIAVAVASGRSLLDWSPGKASSVLYVDGEMPGDQLQERVRTLTGAQPDSLPLQFLARDLSHDCPFNLSRHEFRQAIDRHADAIDAKLIVLDNLSTLWCGKENDAESWDDMQYWLIGLRKKGRSVIIVHHAGKSGQQRGSSRKEDSLDITLALRRLESSAQSEGLGFNAKFEKTRSKRGEAVENFHATFRESEDLGLGSWKRSAVRVESSDEAMLALVESGVSQAEIARRMGRAPSTVSRLVKKAKETGLLLISDGATRQASDEEESAD